MNVLLVSGLGYDGPISQQPCYGWQYLFQDPEFKVFHLSLACQIETFNAKLEQYPSLHLAYDLIFLVMSKEYPAWINALHQLRKYFLETPIAIMQEGAVEEMYHPARIHDAQSHLATIADYDTPYHPSEYDILFCHNRISERFYSAVTHHPVRILPTAYPIDFVKQFRLPLSKRTRVLINGSFSMEYNGLVNMYAVRMRNDDATMCRRYSEWNNWFSSLGGLSNEIPEMPWVDWIKAIAKYRIMVAVNHSIGSGSVPLACACLGIPCIGNELDYPMKLFPDLRCHPNDLSKIQDLVKWLDNDGRREWQVKYAYMILPEFSRENVKKQFLENIKDLYSYFLG